MNEIIESIESMRWVLLGTGVALWLWFAYVVGPHMWRWWRGRREVERAARCEGAPRVAASFHEARWNNGVLEYKIPKHVVCGLECGGGWVKPIWPEDIAFASAIAGPKPAPDHKYQGDQVSGLRKELLALEEQIDKRLGDAEARLGTVEVHLFAPHCAPVTPAPVEAGVRVFQGKYLNWVVHNGCDYVTSKSNPHGLGWLHHTSIRCASDAVAVPEDSPEYQRIVESWMAWRAGQ